MALLKAVSTGLLLVAVSIGAMACGNSDSSGASKRVAVVLANPGNPYWGEVAKGAEQAKAAAPRDVDVSITATARDLAAEELFAKVEDAIATNPDALAVVPELPEEITSVLRRALDEGIPVVTIDTPVVDIEETAFVGTDNVEGGRVAGEYVAERLSPGDTVGILHAYPGVTTSDQRVQGFKEALEGTGIRVVTTIDARGDLAKARAAMEDIQTAHPDIDAIFSVSDGQTLGALQALSADDRPIFVSFDAQPDAVKQIVAGKLDATVAQFPDRMGKLGVEAAIQLAQGRTVPKTVDTGVELVTDDNAQEWLD